MNEIKKPPKRWRYVCLALLLLSSALYYIGGRATGTAKPWVWHRSDNELASKRNNTSFFSIQGGITASHTGANSGTVRVYNEINGIDFSSVVVRSGSPHPLSVICAEKIAEKLKTIPAIKRVEFAPHGPLVAKDEPLPMWIVQVNVDGLNEWTIPNRSLSGVVEVSSGVEFGTAARREASAYAGTAPYVST